MTARNKVVGALCLWAVAALIGFAVEAGVLRAFDVAVSLGVAAPVRAAGWSVAIMLFASVLGSAAVRLPIAAIVTLVLAWRRDRVSAGMLAASTIGMLLGNMALKQLVGRARPELLPHLAVETSLSFPSGHASNAAAVCLAFGWVAVRRGERPGRAWPVAIAVILVIGVSRVVLGVHWPTDVLAGWCVGAGWMLVCAAVAHRFDRGAGVGRSSTR